MTTHRLTFALAAVLLATCVLSACNKAKSPEEVAKDTAAAENTAVENTAKAEEKAGDKVSSAETVINDEKTAAAHTAAVEAEKVADAKAEGDHKVAVAQCESLGGDQQKACKEQADAALQIAQDQARQSKANLDPKP